MTDVITAFKKNKFKVLTIPPYKYSFNMVELTFRFIKNITYKNIYISIEQMKDEVEKILQGEDIKKSLINMYREIPIKYIFLGFCLVFKTYKNLSIKNDDLSIPRYAIN